MIKSFVRSLFPKDIWFQMSKIKWYIYSLLMRVYHFCVLKRVKAKVQKGEKLRVAFIESEIAKWKTQSLFDLMKSDPHYEPFMLICRRDGDANKLKEEIERGIEQAMAIFKEKGNTCFNSYDPNDPDLTNLKKYDPDLVFYQQPWTCEGSMYSVSRYALPCYVPYYVANYGSLPLDAKKAFHRILAYFFMQSEAWVQTLTDWAPRFYYSGKCVPVGHTSLDYAYLHPPKTPTSQCVIYAPHFSFVTDTIDNVTGISTFAWTGREILEYAKTHPEMNWVFKPHPVLYRTVIEKGLMTQTEIDAYYEAWGRLGRVCDSCDYQQLFEEATTMITDCGSFLTEFGATGKPIVHLISARAKIHPMKPSQELYSTYYQVHNPDEMYKIFEIVLEKQEDPNKKIRQAAVRKAGLQGNYAAKNIMDFFDKEFGIKR